MVESPKCSYCLKIISSKLQTSSICECIMCLRCIELQLRKKIINCWICKTNLNFGDRVYNYEFDNFATCSKVPRNPIMTRNTEERLSRLTYLAYQAHKCEIGKYVFKDLSVFNKLKTIESCNLKEFDNISLKAFDSTFGIIQALKKEYFKIMLNEIKTVNSNPKEVQFSGSELGFSRLGQGSKIYMKQLDKNIEIKGLGIILPNKSILGGRIKAVEMSSKGKTIFKKIIETENIGSCETTYELALQNVFMNDASSRYEISFDLDEGYYFTMKHAEYFYNDQDSLLISIENSLSESLLAYIRYN